MVGPTLTLGRTHFSALERYKNGEGNGDPNCSSDLFDEGYIPPLKLGSWLSESASSKER